MFPWVLFIQLQRRQDVVPDKIELALEICHVGGDGDDGILVGNDDDVLPSGSVSTEATGTTTPHLIAIALHPVCLLYTSPSPRDRG